MIYTNEVIMKKNNRKKLIKKIFKIICFPIILAIVLLAIYIGYARFIKRDNDIGLFGWKYGAKL